MSLLKLSLITIVALIINGCGFHLRGSQTLPPGTDYLALYAKDPHSLLVRAINKRLDLYDINGGTSLPEQYKDSAVIMRISPEDLDRRLLSVFSNGQVAEYELIYSVKYSVSIAGGEAKPAQFEVLREYQDDPDEILAKSRELDIVLNEMRIEAADRMLRLLSSQSSSR